MDLMTTDGLARIVAEVPLDTLLTGILEQPNFTNSPARLSGLLFLEQAPGRLLVDQVEQCNACLRSACGLRMAYNYFILFYF